MPEVSTPPVRRFLAAWAMGVALFLAVVVPAADLLLFRWPDTPVVRWIEAVDLRKRHFAHAAEGQPRLLIVGGSSGLFSVDAERLTEALGVPAFNMATHAGLGLRTLLEDAREIAQPGDTVLLYLEYAHYRLKPFPMNDIERQVLWTSRPSRLLHLPVREVAAQVYGSPWTEYRDGWIRLERWMTNAEQPGAVIKGYSPIEYGPHGDFRGEVPGPYSPSPIDVTTIQGVGKRQGELLTKFFYWCGKKNIRVAVARPAMLRDGKASAEQVDAAYRSAEPFFEKARIPLIDTRALFQLGPELFLDTNYHANDAGRQVVTDQLARELAKMLGRELRAAPRVEEAARFSEWLQTFPNHMFACVAVDESDGRGRHSLLFGTGPYRGVSMVSSGDRPISIAGRAAWQTNLPFPLSYHLSSGPVGTIAPIIIARHAVFPQLSPGLSVAVVDPLSGTVVKRGIFGR